MTKRRFEIETDSGYIYQGDHLVGHVSCLLREPSARGKQIKRQWDGYMHQLQGPSAKVGLVSSVQSKEKLRVDLDQAT